MINDKSCPGTPRRLSERQGRGSRAAVNVCFGFGLLIDSRFVRFVCFFKCVCALVILGKCITSGMSLTFNIRQNEITLSQEHKV